MLGPELKTLFTFWLLLIIGMTIPGVFPIKITMVLHGQKVKYEIFSFRCFQLKSYFLQKLFF